ncbi:MAG: hypothetical protein WC680_05380 [Sulfuricurvum sp.]|jgi:hypothetical protein
MSHYADKYDRSLREAKPHLEDVQAYQKEAKKLRREKEAFLHREFDYRDYIFAPEGYEGVMLSLYIAVIPYLVALAFLFVFIAKSSYQYFLEFNLSSYFIIWAIGYEVCAVLAIIVFFYAWFTDDSPDETPTRGARVNKGIAPRFRN